MVNFASKLNGNSIILYDHNDHGKLLFDLAVASGRKTFMIFGETELDKREDIRSLMESESGILLVANTKCFSVGINIKNIQNIIFAFSSGKGITKIMQSIGRGLRRTEYKHTMNLVDFYHNFKYSTIHYRKRKKLYSNYRALVKEQKVVIDD